MNICTNSVFAKVTGLLFCSTLLLPGFASAASISTSANLGVSDFSGIGDSEFNNGVLPRTRVEHDGTLIPTSLAFTGTVSGHSDISAGSMRATGSVTSNPGDPSSMGLDGGVIFGSASIFDEVTFTNTLTGDFDVTINMYVSGDINTGGGDVSAGASLFAGSEFDFGSYSGDGPINDILSATITLTNSNPINISSSVSYSVDTYLGNGAVSDVDISAYLELIIEDEVVFSSESTFFLATPVPVPPALPLLLGGVASLFSIARRRRNV